MRITILTAIGVLLLNLLNIKQAEAQVCDCQCELNNCAVAVADAWNVSNGMRRAYTYLTGNEQVLHYCGSPFGDASFAIALPGSNECEPNRFLLPVGCSAMANCEEQLEAAQADAEAWIVFVARLIKGSGKQK